MSLVYPILSPRENAIRYRVYVELTLATPGLLLWFTVTTPVAELILMN